MIVRLAALMCLGLLLGGCSSSAPRSDPSTEAISDQKDETRQSPATERPELDGDPQDEQSSEPSQPKSSEGNSSSRRRPSSETHQLDLRRASSELQDPIDRESGGDAPGYTEITSAAIRGRGKAVEISTSFAEAIPLRMPDSDTFMIVQTKIERSDDTYLVFAKGGRNGWTGYVGNSKGSRRTDRFTIDGQTLTFDLPWAAIGGPGRFAWSATSSWTHGTLTKTDYSFDSIPNEGSTRYPDRSG